MKRCTFKQGKFHCGSYAFNLYNEDIAQGKYCDRHYWQDQAQKARADEREACAMVCDDLYRAWTLTDQEDLEPPDALDCKRAIKARGNT